MPEDYSLPQNLLSIDVSDLRKSIIDMPSHIEYGRRLADAAEISRKQYSSIIITGMGGSSIAALMLQAYLSDQPLRIVVNQDYSLPKWVSKDCLVIASSYSGNTEETLSAFKEARRAGCDIIAVTCGGKLAEAAKLPRLPIVRLPEGFQPRAAMALSFFAILRIIERTGMIPEQAQADFQKCASDLKAQLPELEKNAIAFSEKVAGKVPLIYTSTRFQPVGYRWKCQFNENSKVHAFANAFSEMNHNEIEAFNNLNANYHAIFLRFDEDHRRVQQRMNIIKDIILKKGVPVTDIGVRSPNLLTKMFLTVLLGDLTAYYLALRLKTDPSEVRMIEDLKRKLGPFVG